MRTPRSASRRPRWCATTTRSRSGSPSFTSGSRPPPSSRSSSRGASSISTCGGTIRRWRCRRSRWSSARADRRKSDRDLQGQVERSLSRGARNSERDRPEPLRRGAQRLAEVALRASRPPGCVTTAASTSASPTTTPSTSSRRTPIPTWPTARISPGPGQRPGTQYRQPSTPQTMNDSSLPRHPVTQRGHLRPRDGRGRGGRGRQRAEGGRHPGARLPGRLRGGPLGRGRRSRRGEGRLVQRRHPRLRPGPRRGRHEHLGRADLPGGPEGTSFAAPYVAGVVALSAPATPGWTTCGYGGASS